MGLLLALLLCASAAWAQVTFQSSGALGQAVKPPQAKTVYHGNVRSKKFHRPGCRYYYCKNCRQRFTSREQALKAGYVPCKVCRP